MIFLMGAVAGWVLGVITALGLQEYGLRRHRRKGGFL